MNKSSKWFDLIFSSLLISLHIQTGRHTSWNKKSLMEIRPCSHSVCMWREYSTDARLASSSPPLPSPLPSPLKISRCSPVQTVECTTSCLLQASLFAPSPPSLPASHLSLLRSQLKVIAPHLLSFAIFFNLLTFFDFCICVDHWDWTDVGLLECKEYKPGGKNKYFWILEENNDPNQKLPSAQFQFTKSMVQRSLSHFGLVHMFCILFLNWSSKAK